MPGYVAIVIGIVVVGLAVLAFGYGRRGERANGGASVRRALTDVIGSAPPGQRGGFVIFGGKRDLDYVQYCLDPNGLELNWPVGQEGGAERLPLFLDYLNAKGYEHVSVTEDGRGLSEQIQSLQKGQYMVLDDGLYCQVGRDVEEIRTMTRELMKSIFGIVDETKFNIMP